MISTFVQIVLILRNKWAFSVSSWGRTPKHNKEVGGVDDSWHLYWLGLDVILDENKKSPAFEKDCDKLGLRALWEGDHYHLQPKELTYIV